MDMLKRIGMRLTALLVVACALPALAADPSPQHISRAAPLIVLATRTVRAGRSHHLGLLLVLIGVAVVLWLLLRWRAVAMGYPDYPGQYPGKYSGQYPGSLPPPAPPGGGSGGDGGG